jgi:signal peptidase I
MQPTIDRDLLLINNFKYMVLGMKPTKGEVVISLTPDNRFKLVCKRISAIEGETVEYVNADGQPVSEVIPPGHVWLLGDNPDLSIDSRGYGPVKNQCLRGQVILKLNGLERVR